MGSAVTSSRTPYNYLGGRNETAGRKRQSTAASMRKPRRNDTRAGANWALEVTPSRGMLFHPRSVPCSPSRPNRPATRRRLPACPLAPSPSSSHDSVTHGNLFPPLALLSSSHSASPPPPPPSLSPYITNRGRHVEDSSGSTNHRETKKSANERQFNRNHCFYFRHC